MKIILYDGIEFLVLLTLDPC